MRYTVISNKGIYEFNEENPKDARNNAIRKIEELKKEEEITKIELIYIHQFESAIGNHEYIIYGEQKNSKNIFENIYYEGKVKGNLIKEYSYYYSIDIIDIMERKEFGYDPYFPVLV